MNRQPIDFLLQKIKRNPPRTQRECCALGARQAIASLGQVAGAVNIKAAALGLAAGLFGEAFERATVRQRMLWIAMCEEEYRKAIGEKP